MNNPIINNRIVNDYTFAMRFKHFLENILVNDAASEEELDYLNMVADNLIQYQIDTVSDEGEIKYLINLGYDIC